MLRTVIKLHILLVYKRVSSILKESKNIVQLVLKIFDKAYNFLHFNAKRFENIVNHTKIVPLLLPWLLE